MCSLLRELLIRAPGTESAASPTAMAASIPTAITRVFVVVCGSSLYKLYYYCYICIKEIPNPF